MSGDVRLPDSVQSVPEALAFWAERAPAAAALIGPGRAVVTYGALWRGAQAVAQALNARGIGRQDRIVLMLPEGPALASILLGTMSAAMAMPLSASLTRSELANALQNMHAAAAIVQLGIPPALKTCLAEHGLKVFVLHAGGAPAAPMLEGKAMGPPRGGGWARAEELAFAVQTSGTTGRPKWVPSEHGRIVEDGRTHRDRFGLDHRDRAIAVAPLPLSLGMTVLLHAIAAGSSLVFPLGSGVAEIWAAIAAEHPTWLFPSAGFLELLARFLRNNPEQPQPASLRLVRVTAAPISPEICDELASRLAAPILPSYSSSEAGLIATALPPPALLKPGSSGQPIQALRIVDDEDRDVGSGMIGEIWVRGPKVFAGYLDDPETNAAAFSAGGWFRTGDTGYLDEEGYLYLTGRLKELINRGGQKIDPGEVDRVLKRHPALADAAAFAVADARLGEDVVAAVVLKPGVTAAPRQLRSWLLDRLSPYKVPRRIWFVAELPRTAMGKVRRGELARCWTEDHP